MSTVSGNDQFLRLRNSQITVFYIIFHTLHFLFFVVDCVTLPYTQLFHQGTSQNSLHIYYEWRGSFPNIKIRGIIEIQLLHWDLSWDYEY